MKHKIKIFLKFSMLMLLMNNIFAEPPNYIPEQFQPVWYSENEIDGKLFVGSIHYRSENHVYTRLRLMHPEDGPLLETPDLGFGGVNRPEIPLEIWVNGGEAQQAELSRFTRFVLRLIRDGSQDNSPLTEGQTAVLADLRNIHYITAKTYDEVTEEFSSQFKNYLIANYKSGNSALTAENINFGKFRAEYEGHYNSQVLIMKGSPPLYSSHPSRGKARAYNLNMSRQDTNDLVTKINSINAKTPPSGLSSEEIGARKNAELAQYILTKPNELRDLQTMARHYCTERAGTANSCCTIL